MQSSVSYAVFCSTRVLFGFISSVKFVLSFWFKYNFAWSISEETLIIEIKILCSKIGYN